MQVVDSQLADYNNYYSKHVMSSDILHATVCAVDSPENSSAVLNETTSSLQQPELLELPSVTQRLCRR